jgi:SAM-dependent methyltransferase
MNPGELDATYSRRFNAHLAYRNLVWSVLAVRYFSRLIAPGSTVLDLGCGYGEFINNIVCKRKYGIDLNARAGEYLAAGVEFFAQDCSQPWPLPDGCLDVVFTSNFFEHLPSKQAFSDTLRQAWRCLRPGGHLYAMGPNIRFIGGAYWDFWDHHLAFTDVSMAEALEVHGFEVERAIDRFLPYTMVNRRRAPAVLLSLYLKFPLAWKIFGKQFMVCAGKPGSPAAGALLE